MSAPGGRAQAEAAVKSCYSTWAQTYHQEYYAGAGAYPPVHQDIVRRLVLTAGARTLLDAGCGPASMLRSLTDLDCDLYGFDLTPEMVVEAQRVMAEHGVPPARLWEGSVADPAAFRRPAMPVQYDAAICIGVLPHVPTAVEEAAIANLHAAVRPGGMVAIEARNELFALFTLNRYSYELIARELVRVEALRATPGVDGAELDLVLEAMKAQFRMDLPPVRGGKSGEPGYDEVLSRTHNPFTLRAQVQAAGFTDVRVLFYHYHALPPMFETAMPETFRRLSVAMEDPEDWRGHFMASAFIVTGRRA
jgi:2-polyprenyl-3-methyl-5-hydroxy-6-metoxy-1,4-benzoquinol methylase